jgi:toxin YhaV
VEGLKRKDSVGYLKKNASKRLAAIIKLAFDVITQDPARPEYQNAAVCRQCDAVTLCARIKP